MNTRTANYCLKQGFVNIKRNKLFSLASIGTIAACIFLIGVIFTIIINVNFMEKKVEQQVGVTIFFNEGLSQQGIDDIGKTIKSDSRVKNIHQQRKLGKVSKRIILKIILIWQKDFQKRIHWLIQHLTQFT